MIGDENMLVCKKCGSKDVVKNGVVSGRQRYRCNVCGCNFREGDKRANDKTIAKKALCILLYAMAKGSYRMFGRIIGVEHSLIFKWIRAYGDSLPEPEESSGITQMEFDELQDFIGSKKTNFESSRQLTVVHGEVWPGYSAIVILQPPSDSTRK